VGLGLKNFPDGLRNSIRRRLRRAPPKKRSIPNPPDRRPPGTPISRGGVAGFLKFRHARVGRHPAPKTVCRGPPSGEGQSSIGCSSLPLQLQSFRLPPKQVTAPLRQATSPPSPPQGYATSSGPDAKPPRASKFSRAFTTPLPGRGPCGTLFRGSRPNQSLTSAARESGPRYLNRRPANGTMFASAPNTTTQNFAAPISPWGSPNSIRSRNSRSNPCPRSLFQASLSS